MINGSKSEQQQYKMGFSLEICVYMSARLRQKSFMGRNVHRNFVPAKCKLEAREAVMRLTAEETSASCWKNNITVCQVSYQEDGNFLHNHPLIEV